MTPQIASSAAMAFFSSHARLIQSLLLLKLPFSPVMHNLIIFFYCCNCLSLHSCMTLSIASIAAFALFSSQAHISQQLLLLQLLFPSVIHNSDNWFYCCNCFFPQSCMTMSIASIAAIACFFRHAQLIQLLLLLHLPFSSGMLNSVNYYYCCNCLFLQSCKTQSITCITAIAFLGSGPEGGDVLQNTGRLFVRFSACPPPSLGAQIPASRLKSQPLGSNPILNA